MPPPVRMSLMNPIAGNNLNSPSIYAAAAVASLFSASQQQAPAGQVKRNMNMFQKSMIANATRSSAYGGGGCGCGK